MTYITCKKVIENKRKALADEEYSVFAADMQNKLDVFLLNDRLTEDQYNELAGMLK